MKLLKFFEKRFTCTGICETTLFYWTLDTNDAVGVPSETCLPNLKKIMTESVAGLAYATLIVGIALFFVWICQYCLWKKYDDNEANDQVKPYKE